MRITFLTPHLNISGGVKLILGYAHRLAKKGHQVVVICPQSIYFKRLLKNFLKYKPHWMKVAADIRYVPFFEEKYLPDGDIIVATAWQTAAYVSNYSASKGKKFYLFMHYERLDIDRFTYKLPLKKIVISSCLQKVLKEKFNENSILIKTPVDLDNFYPTREKYHADKEICMLYHPAKWKGVVDGIEAFKIAKQKFPEIKLTMFGARKKGVDVDCKYYYRPSDKKLREIYNSCDIFLCPSWAEGFGLPSAEAMACKCALVTTDNGGCQDYAFDGKTALVSEPRKPELLANNLIRLLADEDLLRRISQNGHEYIKQFRWDEAVNKMEKTFLTDLIK